MELYLDSADLKEIEEACSLGFLSGLTTTPTFMHRGGVTNVDDMVIRLSHMVPVLQIEALGETADAIVKEAHRQLALGLDPQKTVFKIPVSLEGVKACYRLRQEGLLVNVHLVYTLQQAYMAMAAGATYVCPLVGRLQDQGHDALQLVRQCVHVAERYHYATKIMFSSVRNVEHVRNAMNIGVHTITVPWKLMKVLTENSFTTIGTQQFFEHTRLLTTRVKDVIKAYNPVVDAGSSLNEALVKMTESGFGSVVVTNGNGHVLGVFTDGDLRRKLQEEGRNVLNHKMGDFEYREPYSIDGDSLLNDALQLFKTSNVDNLLVMDGGHPIGMLDIQDVQPL
ncbi:MAG: CBS domain-containing protein [Bacteroidia bacterium]|nr:CBS domain-containing protein [Bacteroidia bacterium]